MRNPSKTDSDRMLVMEAAQGTLPLMMKMWGIDGMGCRRVPMRGMGAAPCAPVGGTMLPIGTPVSGGCRTRGMGLTFRASARPSTRGCTVEQDDIGLWIKCGKTSKLFWRMPR